MESFIFKSGKNIYEFYVFFLQILKVAKTYMKV